jgi:hypothetical protein
MLAEGAAAPEYRKHGLEIQAPWCHAILTGEKTIETRSYVLLLNQQTGREEKDKWEREEKAKGV